MSQEKTTLEVIAPTVEEAIEDGIAQLGISRDAVEVEILDSGTRGIFGIGNRQARIRLTVKSAGDLAIPESIDEVGEKDFPKSEKIEAEDVEEEQKDRTQRQESFDGEDGNSLEVAQSVVEDLLSRMKVQATVSASYVPAKESDDRTVILVDVNGDDLSILIGRRAETLNALQYITGLIVSKELGRWVPLMVDVQGYRQRRERQLCQLAHRMADQAINTGRRQKLEPMSASERRLVHIELRDHPSVVTESIGEEPHRKVTIFLKNQI